MNFNGIFKIGVILSLFCWIYFGYLVYISVYPPASTNIIQFVGELVTIPLLLFVVFTVIFSVVGILRKQNTKKYLLLLLINALTIGFLVYNSL